MKINIGTTQTESFTVHYNDAALGVQCISSWAQITLYDNVASCRKSQVTHISGMIVLQRGHPDCN